MLGVVALGKIQPRIRPTQVQFCFKVPDPSIGVFPYSIEKNAQFFDLLPMNCQFRGSTLEN